ncbi:MAG: hypothetical protein IKY02_01485, partial [Lachnospiraceae bacterium]|nr:hypothetical protein [Lachnospiraceae bacterium]
MKKKLIVLLLSAVFVLYSSVSVYADYLGTLYYWYSGSDSIGRFSQSSIYVSLTNLSSSPSSSFPIDSAFYHAVGQWNNALDPLISTSYLTNPLIQVYGGTAIQLTLQGYPYSYYSLIAGRTIRTEQFEGTWDYNDGATIIYGNLISSSVCLIVENGRTLEQYKNTVTHEMGHALGW